MAQTVAASTSSNPSVPAQAEPQYYLKYGAEVRTLGADQIRLEVATKVVHPDSLICKVGDTQWRSLSDAGALGLDLPSLHSPASGIVSKPEGAQQVGAQFSRDPFARPSLGQRLAALKNKGTIAVWVISLGVSTTIVLQRNGTLRSVAEGWGMKDGYVSFERDVFGGPGEGTVPAAESRWNELVPEGSTPFSEIDARLSGNSEEKTPPPD